jgi:hypothetical protein
MQVLFTTNGIFTVPPGVFSLFVECVGGGGGGGDGNDSTDDDSGGGGAGGGGGAYAASTIVTYPGNTHTIEIGAGGLPFNDAGSTSFDSGLILADFGVYGGIGAGDIGGTGGAGGLASNSVGDITINGFDGIDGVQSVSVAGSVGGAAGGLGGTGGAGGAPIFGNGSVGNPYGGGGGGGGGGLSGNGFGGTGADGAVKISYYTVYGFTTNPPHQRHGGPSPHGPNPGPISSPYGPIPHDVPLNQYTVTRGIGLRRKWFLGSVGLLPLPPSLPECINTQTVSHVSTTTTTWTVPPGVYNVLVKAQGEGGNGGDAGSCAGGTIGGGGGGYAVSLLPVLPGQTYNITVGSGGTGTDTLFSGPGGTVIGYAGVNFGPGSGALGQYTANGGNSFVPPPYNGAAGGFAGSGAFGGAGGIGFPGCSFGATVTVVFNDAGDLAGCGGPFTKTLTWNGSEFVGDGDYGTCPKDATSWGGGSCCGGWGMITIEFEAPIFYLIPDGGNTCGNIILYGAGGASATITGGAGSCTPGNPGLPGTLGSGGGGGGGGSGGGVGGVGGAGFIEISWGNPFGLNGFAHQTHTTTQTNFTVSNCTPLNQYTTTKGIGMRRKAILGAAMLPPPFPPHLTLLCTRLYSSFEDFVEGETTWTVPFGVYQILVECQADGANGNNGDLGSDGNGGQGGTGGTGGGYASSIINVIPGVTYTLTSNIGVTTEFGPSPLVQASSGGLGGGASGDLAIPGTPGWSGQPGIPTPIGNGGNGGAGGDSGYASAGGSGGAGSITFPGPPATNGTNGSNWGAGGGGGGGGSGSMETPGFGGLGGAAFIRISWRSFFGFEGDTHQTHTTTQTNFSLLHCTPLNQYTTTKGIGLRRKYILAAAMLPAPPIIPIPIYINKRSCNCQFD